AELIERQRQLISPRLIFPRGDDNTNRHRQLARRREDPSCPEGLIIRMRGEHDQLVERAERVRVQRGETRPTGVGAPFAGARRGGGRVKAHHHEPAESRWAPRDASSPPRWYWEAYSSRSAQRRAVGSSSARAAGPRMSRTAASVSSTASATTPRTVWASTAMPSGSSAPAALSICAAEYSRITRADSSAR